MPTDQKNELADVAADLVALSERLIAGEVTRAELDEMLGELRATAVREFGPRPPAKRGEGGKPLILLYLIERLGEWVHGEELAAVSQIRESARRTRELRTQDGYEVEERDGYYRLKNPERDEEAADAWRIPNRIRKIKGSGSTRLLELFKAYQGQVLDQKLLGYVAKIPSARRRIRELRDEEGWPIESNIDAKDLKPGQYRLASADPDDRREPRQRLYPDDLREQVFKRDKYTCQMCGRNRRQAEMEGDNRFYLEVHHKKAVADELDELSREQLNDKSNLVTYCHRDHIKETREFQQKRRAKRSSG